MRHLNYTKLWLSALRFGFLISILYFTPQIIFAQCTNISPTTNCNQVPVSLPFQLLFNGNAGGIADTNNVGTGFTMVQVASNTRLSQDLPVSFAAYPSYEPGRIKIQNGLMTIRANKGLAQTTSNNQVNTLGVGVLGQNKVFSIESALSSTNTGGNGAQAGIWYGLDDKTFVKLVITNTSQIEFRVERNDISDNTLDRIGLTQITGLFSNNVNLKLVVNNQSNPQTVQAFYKVGNNAEVYVGEFSHTMGNGQTLGGVVNNVSYAGVLASYRNNTVSFNARFDNFIITPIIVTPILSFQPNNQNVSALTNEVKNFNVNLNTSDNSTPTVNLQAVDNQGNTPNWLKINNNILNNTFTYNLDGAPIPFTIETTGLSIGNYTATVTASSNGYENGAFTVNLSVNPRSLTFTSANLNYSLTYNGTTSSQSNILTTNDGQLPLVKLQALDNQSNTPSWLRVNGGVLDQNFSYQLNNSPIPFAIVSSGLAIGSYSATVSASHPEYVGANFQVNLTVNPGTIQFSVNQLSFTVAQNAVSTNKSVNISASDAGVVLTLTPQYGNEWINAPTTGGVGSLALNVNAGGFAPGNYVGKLIASAEGYESAELTVNMTVTEIERTVTSWDYRINFQRSGTPPSGWIADLGNSYGDRGSGRTFGWIRNSTQEVFTNTNQFKTLSATTYPSLALELRTIAQMQVLGNEANWEMALPNGWYMVRVSAGDMTTPFTRHRLNVEGVKVLEFNQTSGGFRQDTAMVQVLDGKLTLDAYGGISTRVNYIWIEALNSAGDNIPPTVNVIYEGVNTGEVGKYRNPLKIKLLANDFGGSNIASVEYSLDGNPFVPYTSPLYIKQVGVHSLTARVKDGNNNVATSPNYKFEVQNVVASGAKMLVENTFKFPNNDNYTFSFVQQNKDGVTLNGPNYQFPTNQNYNHDVNIIRIHNKGVNPLIINDIDLSDENNFQITQFDGVNITNTGQLNNLFPFSLPSNDFVDVRVIFKARNLNTRIRVLTAQITIKSNDDLMPVKTLNLRGMYQQKMEGNNEPFTSEMFEAFGFKSLTGFTNFNNNHQTPIADEIFSSYYVRADTSKAIRVVQIAGYEKCCTVQTSLVWHTKSNPANKITLMTRGGKDAQTLLPRRSNGTMSEATFSTNSPFALQIGGDNTDPALNTFTGTNRFGVAYPNLRGIRVWKVIDNEGKTVPNAYFFCHDYMSQGANLDYNDNLYYIENVRPELGTDYISELVPGNGINGDPNQKQTILDFGVSQVNNNISKVLTVRSLGKTYANALDDPQITLGEMEIIGQNASEFSVGTPLKTILKPNENTTVNVNFNPQSVGLKSAILVIHTLPNTEPLKIPLFGVANSSSVQINLTNRIKAGRPNGSSVTIDGNVWVSDIPFRTGSTIALNTNNTTSEIHLTEADALYRSYLSSTADNQNIGLNIPQSNGKYWIRLHFAENQIVSNGNRVFNIVGEGNLLKASKDVFGESGYHTANVQDVVLNVNDGELNIQLNPIVGRAILSGVEIFEEINTPEPPAAPKMQKPEVVKKETPKIQKIRVYPNPVQDFVEVEIPESDINQAVRYELVNLKGERILRGEGRVADLKAELNSRVGNLATGIYIIRVFSTSQTYTTRLLKN
jgi:hypothetical protein